MHNLVYDPYTVQTGIITVPPVAVKRIGKKSLRLAKALAGLGALLLVITYAQSAYYTVSGIVLGDRVSEYIAGTALAAGEQNFGDSTLPRETYTPRLDKSLPLGNHLIIPSLGVDTSINEAPLARYEDALKKGVWRVTDFGTPTAAKRPIILAAHRFGYLKWSNSFRRHNSFYNLPDLKNGDTVEIVWNQRKYTYAVYAESNGERIEDYSADLVLYTCNDLASDVRIIKYLKLLEI